jgi:hypothetical protein
MPASTFVQITGKHIKKQINIGTFEDENQRSAIIIKERTGVDFMAIIKGFNKSCIHLLILEATAAINPINMENTIPKRTLYME